MVITALALTVLVGMSALVIDIGLLFLTRTELARAADAAALAGASRVLEGDGVAKQEAVKYLKANGMDDANPIIKVDNQERKVDIKLSKQVNFFFAPIFGKKSSAVSVRARAINASITGVKGVVPVGLSEEQHQQITNDIRYILKWSSEQTTNEAGKGNFGVLDFTSGGGGATDYQNYAAYGYQEFTRVGDLITAETGNMSGPTIKGFKNRIDRCGLQEQCNWDNYEVDCPRVITIPVYRVVSGSGSNLTYQIVGFASFWIEEVGNNGINSYVAGYFIRRYLPGEVASGQVDYGLRSVKLIK